MQCLTEHNKRLFPKSLSEKGGISLELHKKLTHIMYFPET
jgi:hypothetical protein